MTEVDVALVRRKPGRIAANIARLAAIEPLSLDAYRAGPLTAKATERLLQETIDAAVDVNLHLLRVQQAEAPPDYYESFIRPGELGVISVTLSRELAPAAGLRNRIVHEYDDVDDAIVLDAVARARRQFAQYIAQVEQYLSSASA